MFGGYRYGYVFTIRQRSQKSGTGTLSSPIFQGSKEEAREVLARTYRPSLYILTYHHLVDSETPRRNP